MSTQDNLAIPQGDLMVQKLFEIADRMAAQAAEGKLKSESITVGTTWHTVTYGWRAVDIFNDGDSDLYVRLDDQATNPWDEGDAPVKKNNSLHLDLNSRKYPAPPEIGLICQTGSASVRLFLFL